MTKSADRALHKHNRILSKQWQHLARAAQRTVSSANQRLVDPTTEALDRCALLDAEAAGRVARTSSFAAQAIACKLIAEECKNEVRETRDFLSAIVPDPDSNTPSRNTPSGRTGPIDSQQC